jgi:hypothetical protein
MVMWPHGGSRAVTATMKLHDYSHIASREILCGKLPKLVSLLKTRLSQRSYVVRSDRLFGRSTVRWLGILLRTFPLRGSHAPRVGAGESRAEAATRRVESASATAAADGDRPDLLDRVGETLEELAEFLAGGAARDRGAVAPPGLQALLGMEEAPPMGSARDWEGPAGSDTADEPRESAVRCAEDPRRAVEVRPYRLAGDGLEVRSPASEEAAIAGVANFLEEPRPGSNRVGFLHGTYRDLSSPVRARCADPQPASAGAF